MSSPSAYRIQLQLGDLTLLKVDAIVNSTDQSLLDGGPVHRAVHEAAGESLAKACEKVGHCNPGEVCLTPGYNLASSFVIHTVAPTWQGGHRGEREALASCYTSALELAFERAFRTIAFPSLGSGLQPQIPLDQAAPVAIHAILQFLDHHPLPEKVVLACYDAPTYHAYQTVLRGMLP
ncbi:MAG: macro domain-containing protein [Firmicutes bacterium]|nr:macro domain-containing protein [Bacillota bacterium]